MTGLASLVARLAASWVLIVTWKDKIVAVEEHATSHLSNISDWWQANDKRLDNDYLLRGKTIPSGHTHTRARSTYESVATWFAGLSIGDHLEPFEGWHWLWECSHQSYHGFFDFSESFEELAERFISRVIRKTTDEDF
jgi:hypothetical protein